MTQETPRKMIAKVWGRTTTQKTIRMMRAAGIVVERDSMGAYTGKAAGPWRIGGEVAKDTIVFRALPGRAGYLIRHLDGLFMYDGARTEVVR